MPRGHQAGVDRATLVWQVGQLWAEDACVHTPCNGHKAVERQARESDRGLVHTGTRTRTRLKRALRKLADAAGQPARVDDLPQSMCANMDGHPSLGAARLDRTVMICP